MTLAVRYTAAARQDLHTIAEYVRQEAGTAVASQLIARIKIKTAKLSRDGPRYRERPELGRGRRAVLVGPYMVFYRVIGETAFVQRVLHSARDIAEAMFRD